MSKAAETRAGQTEAEAEPQGEASPESATTDEAPVTFEPDAVLLASTDLARTALAEITPAETIGEVVGSVADGEQVLTLLFDCTLAGYPGWRWQATLARTGDSQPTVLEIGLLPGEDAVVAPDWIPWSERMADYTAGQEVGVDDSDDEDHEDDDHEDDDELIDEDIDEDDLVDDELDDALDHLDEDDIVED
jgi:hypothetical protein